MYRVRTDTLGLTLDGMALVGCLASSSELPVCRARLRCRSYLHNGSMSKSSELLCEASVLQTLKQMDVGCCYLLSITSIQMGVCRAPNEWGTRGHKGLCRLAKDKVSVKRGT